MNKRQLGSSNLEIAPLVLGGNVFGWTADEQTSFAILDAFVDAGGTMIDTADIYSAWAPGHSGGESERVIGAWLKRDPAKRAKVQVATKVGLMDGGLAPDTIAAACDASLRRLGIDCIDLYYQHKDDEGVPLADSLGAFERLREAGKIGETGLSQFEPTRLQEAVGVCDDQGWRRPAALQTWYNLVERAKLEGPLLDAALDGGMGVLSFFSLANGFLAGKYRATEDLGKSVRGVRNVEYLDGRGPRVLAALDAIAAETGAALATISLAWTMAKPGITGALASATSLEQLRELLAAMHLQLAPEQTARLDAASAESHIA
jgi:aryl-alcohol dehydrogenase-like predicted oxidoreductase